VGVAVAGELLVASVEALFPGVRRIELSR